MIAPLPPAEPVTTHAPDPLRQAAAFPDAVAAAIARQEAAAAASRSAAPAPPPTSPTDLPAGLLCVRDHESGGNYQAVNSLGYAGAYQFSPAYWPAWAARYGEVAWAGTNPAQVPPAVQDAVALGLWDAGATVWRDWAPYTCPWP